MDIRTDCRLSPRINESFDLMAIDLDIDVEHGDGSERFRLVIWLVSLQLPFCNHRFIDELPIERF